MLANGNCRRHLSLADLSEYLLVSTLVDRIVTGYPRDEVAALEAQTGYKDAFLDTAEHFYLFVIRGLPRWRPSCVSINCR